MFGEDKCILPNKFYKSGFYAINVPGMWALWNKLYKRKFLLDNNFELPEHAKVCHDECFNTVVFPKAKGVICIKDKFYRSMYSCSFIRGDFKLIFIYIFINLIVNRFDYFRNGGDKDAIQKILVFFFVVF